MIIRIVKLLFVLFLFISFQLLAQESKSKIIDDKVILLENYNNGKNLYSMMFEDYDNKDNLWYGSITDTSYNVYKVDNNLNITKTIINNRGEFLLFKLNDNFYGLRTKISYSNSTGIIMDSIFFYKNDTNGNNIITKILFTSKDDTIRSCTSGGICFLTKESNIVLFFPVKDTNSNIYYKLLVTDLNGDKIASKLLNYSNTSSILSESDSMFVINGTLSNYGNLIKSSVKYIDKKTLNIIDSVDFDTPFRLGYNKKINDSIIVFISDGENTINNEPNKYSIRIVNNNSLKVDKKIDVVYGGSFVETSYKPIMQEVIDFRNTDSIYYCCFVRNSGGVYENDFSGFIQIVNFGLDGNLNFDYRFKYDSINPKQIHGIKATADGGLLVVVQIQGTSSWIIKFMPNGFVGLTEVSTGKKEGLKVYPNPAKDFVLVDIEADRFVEADIEIYDLGGRMVKSSKLTAKVGNRIDVSDLKAGVYGYRVVLNGKGVSGKIVIG